MKKLGEIPKQLLNKAAKIIELFQKGIRHGWKKLAGLKNVFYSFRLSMNYRLLTDGRTFFVGSHDAYENKIKTIKKHGH
ncbi:hypothetical protein J6Z39_09410 [bacterium]|nr:hypothetical protein [bacterium]